MCIRDRWESLPKPWGPVACWILFCVFCNCAGWLLSAVHQLNATGYSVALSVLLLLAIAFRKRLFSNRPIGGRLKKLRRRVRRMFPLAYLVLAIMAILGGRSLAARQPGWADAAHPTGSPLAG